MLLAEPYDDRRGLWRGADVDKEIEGAPPEWGVFEAYVEHFLAPVLRPGQCVVMDHWETRVRELIEERGCELIYLLTPRTSTR